MWCLYGTRINATIPQGDMTLNYGCSGCSMDSYLGEQQHRWKSWQSHSLSEWWLQSGTGTTGQAGLTAMTQGTAG